MVDYHKVRSIAEAEKLRMRKWVISSLLDSEETYLEYLNTLLLVCIFEFSCIFWRHIEYLFTVYETTESYYLDVNASYV